MMKIILPYEQFSKDFEILEKIGEGKFGKVFCAQPRETGNYLKHILPGDTEQFSKVAAKFLLTSNASDKLRLRQEIDILGKVRHRNIVRLLMSYEDPENFIQVFEMLSGGELFQRLSNQESWPTESEVKVYIYQVCDSLSFLADLNIVHLDLKPSNIIFENQRSNTIKLVDFGLSRILEPGREILVIHGTPEFVSPEVVKKEPISLTTDLWSLGVLTYVLLSGLSPFLGETIEETYDNIRRCEFSLIEEPFENTSEASKDFISNLLVLDQGKRLSASEALRHDWLRSTNSSSRIAKPRKSISQDETLKRFIKKLSFNE